MNKIIQKYTTNLLIAIVVATAILFGFFSKNKNAQNQNDAKNEVNLYVFYGQGCPHCSSLLSFLNKIKGNYPTLRIYEDEVYQNSDNRKLFEELADKFNTKVEGVPTVFIDDKVIVGFSNEVSVSLENEIKRCLSEECGNPVEKTKSEDAGEILGVFSPTLPIVMGAAVVDSINPCVFVVLVYSI